MDYKKVITVVAGKLYKKPEQEVTDLLQTEGSEDGDFDEQKVIEFFESEDKKKVSKMKGEAPKWSDAYNKATKEVRGEFEQKLKDSFEIQSDLQGDELLQHLVEVVNKKLPEGKQITDDDIKTHPLFTQAIKDLQKQLKDKDTEKVKAIEELEAKYANQEVLSEVVKLADEHLPKIGELMLSSDSARAQKQKDRLYFDPLKQMKWTKKDGKFYPLDEDGKIMTDEHGYAMEATDVFERVAKDGLDFKVAKDRQSPPVGSDSPPTKDKPQKKYSGKAPSNKQEYMKMLTGSDEFKTLTSEQKLEIKQTYGEQFSKN